MALPTPTPKKPYVDLKKPHELDALMRPGQGALVIDFWAPWCAPCRAMAPHFEAVAHEQRQLGRPVRFFKVNTEQAPKLGAAFHVQALPTVLFIHDGKVMDVNLGAMNGGRLTERVEWLLRKASGETWWTRVRRMFGGDGAGVRAGS